jgi:hypothetical protein
MDDIEPLLKPIAFKEATDEDIDKYIEDLRVCLKRRVKTARALKLAQAAEAKALKELSYVKGDLQQLTGSLIAI